MVCYFYQALFISATYTLHTQIVQQVIVALIDLLINEEMKSASS